MKVLFDNNVPRPLRHRLSGHLVSTAREMGWHELENGDLLRAGEDAGFEVMVKGDKNLSYQQNLTGRQLALVVLETIRWKVLRDDTSSILAAVDRASRAGSRWLNCQPESLDSIPATIRALSALVT